LGVALGLAAALCWGFADYIAALASRSAGALRVVLGFHLLATLGLGIACVATGALDDVTWDNIPPFFGIGALGAASYLAFYRALAIGPISIVSPIVSGYAAVTVILAVIIIGDRLSAGELAALFIVLLGVALASSDLAQLHRIDRGQAVGLLLAVVAMGAIGAFVFGVAYYAEELGWLAPIFLGRAFSTLFIGAVAAAKRELPGRDPRYWRAVSLIALVDTAGYVAFNVGARNAETAVVATASAPYSIVPIILGVVLLHERPARIQWLGIVLTVAGVVLLGLAAV
jgi:drug/metabolite transporter (DMT)-like permease